MNFIREKFKRSFTAIFIFTLLQKNLESKKFIVEKLEKDKTDFGRIRCPHCKWQPTASSIWFCSDCDFPEFFYNACGTVWNTFNTRGKCPGCRHQWRWTSCLSCGEWALHEDWYAKEAK